MLILKAKNIRSPENFGVRDIEYDLSNVKIEFLSPNLTSVIQPMGACIIKAFKYHYKKFLIKFS